MKANLYLPLITHIIFMTTPTAATIIMMSASTSKSILMTLRTAAYTNMPVMTHISNTLINAPRISEKQELLNYFGNIGILTIKVYFTEIEHITIKVFFLISM